MKGRFEDEYKDLFGGETGGAAVQEKKIRRAFARMIFGSDD